MQKIFHIGLLLVYLHIFLIYLYWGRLSSDPANMHYLNMFFIADFDKFCQYYDLNRKLAKKFVKKAKIYKIAMYILICSFTVAFYWLIIRCLVISYMNIPFVYFLLIACPMALIELFSYLWLLFSFLVNLLMAVLTLEFLILRAKNISNNLINKFRNNPVVQYGPKKQNRRRLPAPKKDHLPIINSINDFVKQFSVSSIVVYAH